MRRTSLASALVAGIALVVAACGGSAGGSGERSGEFPIHPGAGDRATISGAGSTFAAPMVREWIDQYRRVAPGVSIEYRAVGSVDGLGQLASGEVDFAASELSLTAAGQSGVDADGDGDVVQVPWTAGGVAVAYNLPDLSTLNLSGATLAAIFSGRLDRWDDPTIEAENPGVELPPTAIRVVHRSRPSGTTQVFTEFLRGAAPERWEAGSGPTVAWPSGAAVEDSDAVVATVTRTTGAVGYVEAGHAMRAGLGTARIKNGVGRFVPPTDEGVDSAIAALNPEAPAAYPIATVSYVAFSAVEADVTRQTALRHFVAWALTEGQRHARRVGYSPVPLPVLITAIARVQGTDGARGRQPADGGR